MGNKVNIVPSDVSLGSASVEAERYHVQCLHSALDITGKFRIHKIKLRWGTLEWILGKRYSEMEEFHRALCAKESLAKLKEIKFPDKKLRSKHNPEVIAERCAFFEEYANMCLNFSGLVSDPLVRSFYCLSQGAPILRVRVLSQWNVLKSETERLHFSVCVDESPHITKEIVHHYTDVQQREFQDEGFCLEVQPNAYIKFWVLGESSVISLWSLPWNIPYCHNFPLKRGKSVGVVGLHFYYECFETPSLRGYCLPSHNEMIVQQNSYLQLQSERKLKEASSSFCSALLLISHQAPSGSFPGFLGVQVQYLTIAESFPTTGEDWYFQFKMGKAIHKTVAKNRNNLSWNGPQDYFQDLWYLGDSLTITLHSRNGAYTSDPVIGECILVPPDFESIDLQYRPVNVILCPPERAHIAVVRSKRHMLMTQLSGTDSIQLIGSGAAKDKKEGWQCNLPVLFIPGFASSALKVTKGQLWEGQRIWISMGKLTSEKLSTKVASSALRVAKNFGLGRDMNDDQIENYFIKYMSLEPDGISDPPGVEIRPEEGIKGCSYLQDGEHFVATSFTYVMGPIIDGLRELGYDDSTMAAAPYDWRLPFHALESRDGYFTNLVKQLEDLYANTGQPTVVVCHSMGNNVFHYFLFWKKSKPGGQEWIDKYVHTFFAVGAPWLGAPKGLCSVVAGVESGLESFISEAHKLQFSRSLGGYPALFPVAPQFHNSFPIEHTKQSYFLTVNPDSSVSARSQEELFSIDQCKHIPNYTKYFMDDPFFGGDPGKETFLQAPPVQRFVHCYGINVDTPKFYFVRQNNINNDWIFDTRPLPKWIPHHLAGYKIVNGTAYETSETKQSERGINKYCSGDGTVPYDSLTYAAAWKSSIPLHFDIHEIENGEHRDLISSAVLFSKLVRYCCINETSSTASKYAGIEDIT